jgi:hypothetical protein
VARDPEESRFGTSVFSKSKGTQRNSETPSCDGSHEDRAEDSTWHHTSAFGGFGRRANHHLSSVDFPIGKSPIHRSVDR